MTEKRPDDRINKKPKDRKIPKDQILNRNNFNLVLQSRKNTKGEYIVY